VTARRAATADQVGTPPASLPPDARADHPLDGDGPIGIAPRLVHRWRDLDRRGRFWAAAVAAALALAPLLAFVHFAPVWTPQADPALMALRALDVGTARTPALGQPSQSGVYAGSAGAAHHPGPVHLYLLAVPVRVLGGAVGMLVVSALVTGACLVTSAWAVFRQLGRTAGVVAAVALAVVAFTTGASSLVNPVSSSIAGYPLLLSAVLFWCVAAGDVRLLPLATVAMSFTMQQHLAVVPAGAVIGAGALVLLAATWRRTGRWRDPASRHDLTVSARRSAVLAAVLWAPVLAQQAFGASGNLGRIVSFARHDDRPDLGLGRALWQAAHALGLPPLLGRASVSGPWLISRPTAVTWMSAAAVVVVVAAVCLRWRTDHPRRATLGPMAAVVLVAGLVNGSSVPVGLEQARLSFYHWTFVLAFFVALVLGLAVAEPAARLARAAIAGRPHAASGIAVLTVLVVAAPAVVNPHLDRRTNDLVATSAYLDADVVDRLADAAAAHADALGDHPVVLTRNSPPYVMYGPTLAFALVEHGIDVRFPLTYRTFVHDSRLVDRHDLNGGLVLVVDDELRTPVDDGELVADADLGTGLAVDDYRALVAEAEAADGVVLADEMAAGLTDGERRAAEAFVDGMLDDPAKALLHPDVLTFLAGDPPLAAPALDADRAARLLASIEDAGGTWRPGTPTGLRLYLLDRDELLDAATTAEIGPSG